MKKKIELGWGHIIILAMFLFFLGLTLLALYIWLNPEPIDPNAQIVEVSANKYTETYVNTGVPLRSTLFTVIICAILTITVPLYFYITLRKNLY